MYVSVIILALSFVLRPWVDSLLIVAATCMVLIAELFNSAIEALCDFIETNENHKIKVIKDIAAAAAGVSIFFWAIVMISETCELWQAFHP